MTEETIIDFWFKELTPDQWFEKDKGLDGEIARRFGGVHAQAVNGELSSWRSTPEGRLAEVIVLDQFSRNIFRDQPGMFAADPLALALAQDAIQSGDDTRLEARKRAFLYLPFMHSESRAIHEIALKLFSAPGLESNLKFERLHKSIIDRFGRFPHRNAILGRESTPEEIEFLKQPGSRF
jgi:uncharacterized protein (DUF924 family)